MIRESVCGTFSSELPIFFNTQGRKLDMRRQRHPFALGWVPAWWPKSSVQRFFAANVLRLTVTL